MDYYEFKSDDKVYIISHSDHISWNKGWERLNDFNLIEINNPIRDPLNNEGHIFPQNSRVTLIASDGYEAITNSDNSLSYLPLKFSVVFSETINESNPNGIEEEIICPFVGTMHEGKALFSFSYKTVNDLKIDASNAPTPTPTPTPISEFITDWRSKTQIGQSIYGESESDGFGFYSEINDEGSIIIASTLPNDNAYVKVFEYINNEWVQIGGDFIGYSYGRISGDGTRIAMIYFDITGANHDYIDIYDYINSSWTKVGSSINTGVSFTWDNKIELSKNGERIIFSNYSEGIVRVYEYTNSDWVQIGDDFIGDDSAKLGIGVDINQDGSRIGIGDINSVKVYEYTNSNWVHIGQTIEMEGTGIQDVDPSNGYSFSLNADGNYLAVGDWNCTFNNTDRMGKVTVYQYLNSNWQQFGQTLNSVYSNYLVSYTKFGIWVDLDDNANTLSVRSDHQSTNGTVGVFKLQNNQWIHIKEYLNEHYAGYSSSFGYYSNINSNGTVLVVGDYISRGRKSSEGRSLNCRRGLKDAGRVNVYSVNDEPSLPDPVYSSPTQIGPCAVNDYYRNNADISDNNEISVIHEFYSDVNDPSSKMYKLVFYTLQNNNWQISSNTSELVLDDASNILATTFNKNKSAFSIIYTNSISNEYKLRLYKYNSSSSSYEKYAQEFTLPINGDWEIVSLKINDTANKLFLAYSPNHVHTLQIYDIDDNSFSKNIQDVIFSYAIRSMNINSLGTRIIVGFQAHPYYENDVNCVYDNGMIEVYDIIDNSLSKIGEFIGTDDQKMVSADISADGNIIAIGAPGAFYNGKSSGVVRVYKYFNDSWIQQGTDIIGDNPNAQLGSTIEINTTGDKLLLGHLNYFDNYLDEYNDYNKFQIYNYSNDEWEVEYEIIHNTCTFNSSKTKLISKNDGRINGYEVCFYDI